MSELGFLAYRLVCASASAAMVVGSAAAVVALDRLARPWVVRCSPRFCLRRFGNGFLKLLSVLESGDSDRVRLVHARWRVRGRRFFSVDGGLGSGATTAASATESDTAP